MYPTSKRTLLVNWRWMVKSKESTTLGRKFVSKASPAAAETSLMPGNVGWGRFGLAAGIGATRPSQPPAVGPTRKALATVRLTVGSQVPFGKPGVRMTLLRH